MHILVENLSVPVWPAMMALEVGYILLVYFLNIAAQMLEGY
mgnify:CR=1 FL=1